MAKTKPIPSNGLRALRPGERRFVAKPQTDGRVAPRLHRRLGRLLNPLRRGLGERRRLDRDGVGADGLGLDGAGPLLGERGTTGRRPQGCRGLDGGGGRCERGGHVSVLLDGCGAGGGVSWRG
jgi:hypothetical protein